MKLMHLLLAMTALAPVPALAQEIAPAGPTDTAAADGNDIVITARKTEERLQDAPTTVAVVTARNIENLGLDNIQDLSKITPGLVFDESFGRDGNRPVIRGQANILGQSGVAYFIDGIYYSGSIADFDVNSIERFEVVKGPQSALYGRNTYSGAINIITKGPGDTWTGTVTADISEHGRYEFTAGVAGPLGGGFGASINSRFYDFDGEYRNAFDGSKIGFQSSRAVSGQLTFDDGGAFRAALRGNYNWTDDGQPVLFAQSANANNCFPDAGALYRGTGRYYCGVIQPGVVSSDYSRQFRNAEDVGLESQVINAGLKLEADVGENLTLTSLTGYNKRVANTRTDGDYSGQSFQTVVFATAPLGPGTLGIVGSTQDFSFSSQNRADDWSEELRLSYEGESLKLILGGYYYRQNDDTYDTRQVPADALARAQASGAAAAAAACARTPGCLRTSNLYTIATPNSRNRNFFDVTNKAMFGAATINLTDSFSISAEGRYAEEKITQRTQTFNQGAIIPVPAVVSATFKKFTPRVTLDWQATPDNLLYAIYAEGQKPGGFNSNQAIVAGFPTFDPENVKSYELGTKNTFLDGTLTANLAVFHNKITGYQITQNISVPPNQVSLTRNGGDARVNGAELSLLMRPSRNLSVTANYALADTKFTSGTDENLGLILDVADDRQVNCSLGDQFPAVAGCQSLYGSIRGKQIPRAPKHTAFVDVDYRHPIGSGDWSVFAGGNVTMTSTSFDQVLNFASTGGSTVVDLRAGFQSDAYRVQFYMRNATDEDSVIQILRYADANNDLRRNFVAGLRPGRRVGVLLTARF